MQTEYACRRETLLRPVRLPELTQEQSLELDYVLPDYCPDFFRLLHCEAVPLITAQGIEGGRVCYTLRVRLRVLYCAEHTSAVQAICQQLEYRRECPLPPAAASMQAPRAAVCASPQYLNCRAVSSRRIDLRGAVQVHIRIAGEEPVDVLAGVSGAGMQCRTDSFAAVPQAVSCEKPFMLSEDIHADAPAPAILSVLRESISLRITGTQAVSGKIVAKGEAAVNLLYAAENGTESLTAVFPFSQICEPEGFADTMPHTVRAVLADSLLTPEAATDGDIRTVHCDLQIILRCYAVRTETAELLTGAYSTLHPVHIRREEIPLLCAPEPFSETLRTEVKLTSPENVLTRIMAAWADTSGLHTENTPEGCTLSGTLCCYVLAAGAEDEPVMLAKKEPFTWALPGLGAVQLPPLTVQRCDYTLTGSDSVGLTVGLLLEGSILRENTVPLITGIELDEEGDFSGEDGNCAMRLYFAKPGETLWDIAERFHVSAEAVRAGNNGVPEVLTEPQMLVVM